MFEISIYPIHSLKAFSNVIHVEHEVTLQQTWGNRDAATMEKGCPRDSIAILLHPLLHAAAVFPNGCVVDCLFNTLAILDKDC